jgi:hypothetical protein
MDEVVWDGVTRAKTVSDDWLRARITLADAARGFDWPRVFSVLREHPELVNSTRPGGRSRFAPLHQAAYGGATADVARDLIQLGAWRTHRTAPGERPLDIAKRRRHKHLTDMLEPIYLHDVPHDVLSRIQVNFHGVILGRAAELVREHRLRLPELEPLLELRETRMWFAVPGMYGGFSFELRLDEAEPCLVAESWCRVVGGSGQRHRVTAAGATLEEEGFI